jgi:hypothetical protein
VQSVFLEDPHIWDDLPGIAAVPGFRTIGGQGIGLQLSFLTETAKNIDRIFKGGGWYSMARQLILFLQSMCFAVAVMLVTNVIFLVIQNGPPPVPLDTEGHMAPYTEYPGGMAGWP